MVVDRGKAAMFFKPSSETSCDFPFLSCRRPSDKCRSRPGLINSEVGMTLFEVIFAMLMLVIFTGVVAVVNEYTVRLFTQSEKQFSDSGERSNGVVIEHRQIQLAMDQMIQVLSQPGISKERLDSGIALEFGSSTSGCVGPDPVSAWRLPMSPVKIPVGYRICLWKTTIEEKSLGNGQSIPGLYILQALPESLGPSKLAVRRLFCRPRPFC